MIWLVPTVELVVFSKRGPEDTACTMHALKMEFNTIIINDDSFTSASKSDWTHLLWKSDLFSDREVRSE